MKLSVTFVLIGNVAVVMKERRIRSKWLAWEFEREE